MADSATSPWTRTATIVPNKGSWEAKFFVPSKGSMTTHNSAAIARRCMSVSRPAASSPRKTAVGNSCPNMCMSFVSADSSASVTMSKSDVLAVWAK